MSVQERFERDLWALGAFAVIALDVIAWVTA